MGGNGVQDTDDLALRRVSGNVQHVEVSVGVEGQRLGLVEALGTHGALGLGLRFCSAVRPPVVTVAAFRKVGTMCS